jgi:hypothetical protein
MSPTMKITTGLLGIVAALGLWAVVPSEKTSETLTRTKQYLKLVGGTQEAQAKLNAFIDEQQGACKAKGLVLQLTPQGLLTCVEAPKPTTPPAPATAAGEKK